MSRDNIAIMRAVFAAWNVDMDAHSALYHRDAVIWPPEDWPEPGPFFGKEAVVRQYEQMRATFDADALEVISMAGVGNRVAVRFIWRGAGRGPEADVHLSGIYTLREGKVLSVEFFWDHAEALETLGLSEQDADSF
jgi:ketosteroid isomerase-like protein